MRFFMLLLAVILLSWHPCLVVGSKRSPTSSRKAMKKDKLEKEGKGKKGKKGGMMMDVIMPDAGYADAYDSLEEQSSPEDDSSPDEPTAPPSCQECDDPGARFLGQAPSYNRVAKRREVFRVKGQRSSQEE